MDSLHPANRRPCSRLLGAGGQDRLDYSGSRSDLAKISITNSVATLATLGIYRFWAKNRVRRYLWSRVSLHGDQAEYTGSGNELLRGFLVALPAIALLFGLGFWLEAVLGIDHPVYWIVEAVLSVRPDLSCLRGPVPGETLSIESYRVARHPLCAGRFERAIRLARPRLGHRRGSQPGNRLRRPPHAPAALSNGPHELRRPSLPARSAGSSAAQALAARLALPGTVPGPLVLLVPGEGVSILRTDDPLRRVFVQVRSWLPAPSSCPSS